MILSLLGPHIVIRQLEIISLRTPYRNDGQFHEENYLATKHDFMIIMEFLITNELDKTVY